MPDFGLLQTPDFARAAIAGLQAGREAGRQQRLDSALAAVDLERPESIMGVLHADPSTGIGLLNASTALASAHREAAGREALGNYLLTTLPGAKGGGQVSGVTQGGTVSPADTSGDVVVTGPSAEEQLIRADPQAYLSVQGNLDKMHDNHRKAIADAADAQGAVATAALQLPYAQRKPYIQSQMNYLAAHGVTQAEIDGFDPTDANLDAQRDQALGVKGILAQQNALRDDARAERNTNSEIASRGLRDSLAVREDGRSAAARVEAHTRFTERNQTSGGGAAPHSSSIPAPSSRAEYAALPAGTRYRAPDGSIRTK